MDTASARCRYSGPAQTPNAPTAPREPKTTSRRRERRSERLMARAVVAFALMGRPKSCPDRADDGIALSQALQRPDLGGCADRQQHGYAIAGFVTAADSQPGNGPEFL